MPRRLALAAVALGFLTLGSARTGNAQNFLMQSAETINKGNFKISLFPVGLFGKNDAPDRWGAAARFGYGFTDSFDMEGKLGVFDGLTLYGLDAELWAAKGDVDLSFQLGGHWANFDDDPDSKALDVAVLASGQVADKLELYGALSFSFESQDGVPDSGFTRAYFVPGLEYKVSDDVDLVTEFGVGLNDDSPHYFAFGISLYLR